MIKYHAISARVPWNYNTTRLDFTGYTYKTNTYYNMVTSSCVVPAAEHAEPLALFGPILFCLILVVVYKPVYLHLHESDLHKANIN